MEQPVKRLDMLVIFDVSMFDKSADVTAVAVAQDLGFENQKSKDFG